MVVEKRKGQSSLLTIGDTTKTITQWAKEAGITTRLLRERIEHNWSEDRLFIKPEDTMIHPFNKNYFDAIDDEHKAYWLGFIWCDGYMAIRNRKNQKSTSYEFKLSLSDIDAPHLVKFNQDLDGNYKVKYYNMTNNSFAPEHKEARLLITNQHFGKTLVNKYGLVPHRCDCSKLLNNIPDDLMKYFIRGVLDADGNFVKYHIIEHGYDVVKYSVLIGTNEDILRAIEKHLVKNGIVTPCERKLQKRHNEDNRDGEYKILNFSGKKQCLDILNYIYKNASIYLDRKYQKYLEIIGDAN